MSMFNTFCFPVDQARRKESTLCKRDRISKAIRHEEPDRVPISDSFWGGFTRRCRGRTHGVVGIGLAVLCGAVILLTYGNYLGGTSN